MTAAVINLHAQRAHSEVGASSASRWLSCPGSVQAQRGRPERPPGPASQNGTICHEAAEFALRGNWNADEIPPSFFASLIDVDPAEARSWVAYYLDAVRAMQGVRFIEVRLDFSRWVPTGFGTADCVLLSVSEKRVVIVDAKFGSQRVDAEDNPQLRLYALGVREWLRTDFEFEEGEFAGFEWEMVIVQPRLDWIASEVISDETLLAFGERASKAAALALGPNPPRNPSDEACQWCAAKGDCKARADVMLAEIRSAFGPVDVAGVEVATEALIASDDMTGEEIARVLRAAPALKKWLADVADHAQAALLAGGEVPGFKVVAARANRVWQDPTRASAALEALGIDTERLWKRSLISPAEAEKLGREAKSLVASLTYKPDGAPSLAPDSDPRPSLTSATATDAFTPLPTR